MAMADGKRPLADCEDSLPPQDAAVATPKKTRLFGVSIKWAASCPHPRAAAMKGFSIEQFVPLRRLAGIGSPCSVAGPPFQGPLPLFHLFIKVSGNFRLSRHARQGETGDIPALVNRFHARSNGTKVVSDHIKLWQCAAINLLLSNRLVVSVIKDQVDGLPDKTF